MTEILAGLSMMPEETFRESVYPLFEEGCVDWLEWSFDMGWSAQGIPNWLEGLLSFYGDEKRLSGHGVHYSALSATWTDWHDRWLTNLKQEVQCRQYVHISEHFGCSRAADYMLAAPLPVPLCKQAIEIGRENLERIHRVTGGPVGLENLALAFGTQDVESQGIFIDTLLAPHNGFVVLDLHNIHCQSINFGIPILELIRSYPLDRVLEIHISGGSFSSSKSGYADKPVRRDTHDGPVPNELYRVLPEVLNLCKNVRVVILERLGKTILDKKTKKEFANEFRQLKKVLKDWNKRRAITCGAESKLNVTGDWLREIPDEIGAADEQRLEELQFTLFNLLEGDRDAAWIKEQLSQDNRFSHFSEYINSIEPRMLEVSQELIKKWGVKATT